jgi:hypothetical protein
VAVFKFLPTICGFFFFCPSWCPDFLTWFPDFKVMERAAGSVWLILAPSKPMADQGEFTGKAVEFHGLELYTICGTGHALLDGKWMISYGQLGHTKPAAPTNSP